MYKLINSSNVPEDKSIFISLENRYENEFIKTAAKRDLPTEVDEAIKNLKRKKDHRYVLVTAMGDGETWGSNKNGDYFPYDSLTGMQNDPVWKEVAGKDERLNEKMELKRRYKTFEDGHFFHHHKNKIEKGDPAFGYIPNSIWNPKMRTVLLIVGVDAKKDPETAERIDRNDLMSVSMGAKLPWDRCSICHSKHKSLLQYCNHLKYNLGKILPNGKRVYAENLFPRFFDISDVTKEAFIAGKQLEKIATYQNGELNSVDLASYYDIGQFDKIAETEKVSTIYKDIPNHIEGAIARVSNTEKDLPHELLKELGKLEPKEAWGALTKAGIIAKPNEFAYVILYNSGHYELADKFIHAKGVVSKPDVKGLDEQLHDLSAIHINHRAERLAKNIPDHVLEDRSIGMLNDRIYKTEKGLRKEAEAVRTVGLGSILSALYLLYRANAQETFGAYGLIGAGISEMIIDHKHADKYLGNNAALTEQLNKQSSVTTPFWQSGKGMIIRGAAGFAAPYIAGAHYQNKINNGEQVGIIGKTIANNPGKLGLATSIAAMNPSAAYKAIKRIGSDTKNAIIKPKV
jgi:hypothetical protein